MESGDQKEKEVFEPLKHLLSLEWERLPDISAMTDDVHQSRKPLKQLKKVRFSDEVEQNYLDSYDIDSSIDTIDNEEKCCDVEYNLSSTDQFEYDVHIVSHGLEFESIENKDAKESINNSHITAPELGISDEIVTDDLSNSDHERCKNSSYFLLSNSSEKDNSFDAMKIKFENLDFNTHIETKEVSSVGNEVSHYNHTVEEMPFPLVENNPDSLLNMDNHSTEICASNNKREEKQLTEVSSNTKKSYQNMCWQKQSGKINVLLNNSNHKISTVSEIKCAVIEAWNTVKTKELKTQKKYEMIKKENSSYSHKPISKDAYTLWKRAKQKKKKIEFNIEEKQDLPYDVQQEISNTNVEEKEMVFKSWKKQKDQTMKENAIKKYREAQKKVADSLMNEQIKKEDAESAYFSWIAHKAEINQKEKIENIWLMQKKKEANELKIQRDKKALEMYYIWLDNKISKKRNYSSIAVKKPPWIPSGY